MQLLAFGVALMGVMFFAASFLVGYVPIGGEVIIAAISFVTLRGARMPEPVDQ